MFRRLTSPAHIWIAFFIVIGVALVALYHDADQLDSGFHYLFARWAWVNPPYFVSVWARPLFTFLYSIPAQLGYPAAKLFTVIICLAAAWQTFRLAQELGFDRAQLAIPFLFLQPSLFLLSSAVYTEPLFALVLVIALRLQLAGKINSALTTVSLLILIRPEGFFIGVLWAVWLLIAKCAIRNPQSAIRVLLLAWGMVLWWASAYLITGDPFWIVHDWPHDWRIDGKFNGTGPIWWYLIQLPLIAGPFLLIPFFAGLVELLKRKLFALGAASFLTLFVLHSLMYWRGWFGSAGYARYFVCVSPVIALTTLAGWNRLAVRPGFGRRLAGATLVLSTVFCFCYVDGWQPTRDARAVEEMRDWLNVHPQPISRLITSQAYMRIIFDRDPRENLPFGSDRMRNLELIKDLPPQTLVFWDEKTGLSWFQLRAEDFQAAGFTALRTQNFKLEGKFFRLPRNGYGGVRFQRIHLFYKEKK